MQDLLHWLVLLNVTTGLASPQFHCKFDNSFETVTDISDPIKWQEQVKETEDTPRNILRLPRLPNYTAAKTMQTYTITSSLKLQLALY